MGNNPLTPEQVCFAAKHHRLIYKYLKKRQLSKEEYYDIVVFGYLKAVQDYFCKEDLQQYAFPPSAIGICPGRLPIIISVCEVKSVQPMWYVSILDRSFPLSAVCHTVTAK